MNVGEEDEIETDVKIGAWVAVCCILGGLAVILMAMAVRAFQCAC